MPQIFHSSMNTIARVSIFGGVFIVVAAFLVGGTIVRSSYVTEAGVIRPQPVPFSHKHHVGECGIDCRYCHRSVESEASAGMPATQVCLDCHSQLWSDSPLLQPVHASRESGKPISWTRVHDLPDFVYFHHGIHVSKGVACETCHGQVDDMPLMWREKSLHMEWCLQCHRDPDKFIRPKDAEFVMGWHPSGDELTSEQLADANGVKSKTNCSVCHR
jgi:hypothetical protein